MAASSLAMTLGAETPLALEKVEFRLLSW